jgi:hypothetical protein
MAVETDEARLIKLTHDVSPAVRVAALKQMCPCRVKDDVDGFYERVFGGFKG